MTISISLVGLQVKLHRNHKLWHLSPINYGTELHLTNHGNLSFWQIMVYTAWLEAQKDPPALECLWPLSAQS